MEIATGWQDQLETAEKQNTDPRLTRITGE